MLYASIMPIHGIGPCRMTKVYMREAPLLRAIARTCYALRMPGPYLVQRFEQGRMVGQSLQD